MGGGGGFFSNPIQAIGNAISGTVKAVEKLAQGDIAGSFKTATNAGANSLGIKNLYDEPSPQNPGATAQAQAQAEGGTPTANASQSTKSAGSAAALSGSQQAVNQSSGSGTLLTGNQGVDPQSLELGKKTLLGG